MKTQRKEKRLEGLQNYKAELDTSKVDKIKTKEEPFEEREEFEDFDDGIPL